ncbi:MAG: DUF503 domain-containing protein [Anaerolineales bacterium]|nr:DUF503 domain-containing protein [Anaerolineales bacterium]
MPVGLLTLHVHLPGCSSLKEKRRRLKPLLARLHREFNISVAELEDMDVWQDAILQCALVSNDNGHVQRSLQVIVHWIETYWPDVTIVDQQLEIV